MKPEILTLVYLTILVPTVFWTGTALSWSESSNSEVYTTEFNFKKQLFGEPSTLTVYVENINASNGEVNVNGVDTQQPGIPFTWDWDDGTVYDGWFPQQHTYADTTRNYIVKVTAHYSGGKTDSAEALVRFVAPVITPISLPSDILVTIPDHAVTLTSRMPGYGIPGNLTYFDDSYFSIVPRSDVEYILSVAAKIQMDFTNDEVFLVNGAFNQVLLRDPAFGGMYSLWYASPVSFGVGDYGFQGDMQYSSFMHEMGHNFTLNSPANYYYGGKIDGNANAIFSESMAQIFQHATAYEIANNFDALGLSEDIAFDLEQNAISSIKLIRSSYENYIASGMDFCSWNEPSTPEDETFNTFMTIAYKFCAYAENAGLGYKNPLKRMMKLLQVFDESLRQKYDQYNNNAPADTFRATLMVTALSYAFSTDLRSEFRELNFPISDEIYEELMNKVNMAQGHICKMEPGWNLISFSVNKCFYQGDKPSGLPACVELVDVKELGFDTLVEWFSFVLTPGDAWQMVMDANDMMDRTASPALNTLKYMSPNSGYWVKIQALEKLEQRVLGADAPRADGTGGANLCLEGTPFDPECPIPLQGGWNLVGYPLEVGYYDDDTVDLPPGVAEWVKVDPPVAAHVFSSLTGKYKMILAEYGAYDPEKSVLLSSLHYIAPCQAYWIDMKESADLVYPTDSVPGKSLDILAR